MHRKVRGVVSNWSSLALLPFQRCLWLRMCVSGWIPRYGSLSTRSPLRRENLSRPFEAWLPCCCHLHWGEYLNLIRIDLWSLRLTEPRNTSVPAEMATSIRTLLSLVSEWSLISLHHLFSRSWMQGTGERVLRFFSQWLRSSRYLYRYGWWWEWMSPFQ